MAYKEYFSVKDLRNELEMYDGEMEVIILDDCKEQREIGDIDISVKGNEPKLVIKMI